MLILLYFIIFVLAIILLSIFIKFCIYMIRNKDSEMKCESKNGFATVNSSGDNNAKEVGRVMENANKAFSDLGVDFKYMQESKK